MFYHIAKTYFYFILYKYINILLKFVLEDFTKIKNKPFKIHGCNLGIFDWRKSVLCPARGGF